MTHPLIRSQQWDQLPLLRDDRVLAVWVRKAVERERDSRSALVVPERISRPRTQR